MNIDEYNRALATSFRILSKKAYSIEEIHTKLINYNYDSQAVDKVVCRLIELGYLDDDSYADEIIRSYKIRGYGYYRIKQELYKRGITHALAKEKLEDFEIDMEVLLNYYQQKLKGIVCDYKLIEKTKAFLQRKGFTYDEISWGLTLYKETLEE